MSELDGTKAPALQCLSNDDREAWKAYWERQGQSWRTEPEIDTELQQYLNKRRQITSDIKEGIYPLKEIKLTRADVEWLLATHQNGRGPVDWSDTSQGTRDGAYLIEANLENTDLSRVHLEGAELENAIVADKQHIGPRLVDARWGETNLAVVDWSQIIMLGDEHEARQRRTPDGKKKEKNTRLKEYQVAV